MQYRKQSRIIADVLITVKDLDEGEGVGVTTLLRRCNLSYVRMKPLVSVLVGAGLLRETQKERSRRYGITQNGITFLRAWSEFDDFAQSFGLKL